MKANNCVENSDKVDLPKIEVADIFRKYGGEYLEKYSASPAQIGVMNQIMTCRTAAQGGHIEFCDTCGHSSNAYNSCRNRHCPKCQTMAKERWLSERTEELLDVPYFHLVFTLPHELNPIILCNMDTLLALLFSCVNEVIKAFAADPQWRLNGQPGFIGVLHTWTQTLLDHFHLHCLIPGGALSHDKSQWTPAKSNFLFKTSSLMAAFKNKYIAGFKKLKEEGELVFPGQTAKFEDPDGFNRLIREIGRKKWCGYAKAPFSGPEKVLEYLARYTHRVAISNYRIQSMEDGKVTFTYKDRSDNSKTKVMTLSAMEFIRRFLLHVLPKGFRKIRYFGFMSPRYKKENIRIIRKLTGNDESGMPQKNKESIEEMMLRLTGKDIKCCPVCGKGRMVAIIELMPEYFEYIVPPGNKKIMNKQNKKTSKNLCNTS